MKYILSIAALFFGLVSSRVYFHNPRGSNNRGADDNNNNVQNNNRLFRARNEETMRQNNDGNDDGEGGYHQSNMPMHYYEGSEFYIEWTNSAGCGKDSSVNCEFVLQYMCDEWLRDGQTSDTIPNNMESDMDMTFGRHESYMHYDMCQGRTRNEGLFSADSFYGPNDDVDNKDTATYTRQTCATGFNCGLQRWGFECPEERDYYPYWHPTPWRDIAVMVDDVTAPHPHDSSKTICDYYQEESQNVRNKGYCMENYAVNTKQECESSGAMWVEAGTGFGIDPPACVQNEMTRENALSNAAHGWPLYYKWTIPQIGSLPMERENGGIIGKKTFEKYRHCALRIRYNVTSNDYDRWNTYAEHDYSEGEDEQLSTFRNELNYQLPAPNDMTVKKNISLASRSMNMGIVYQDRSYEFEIRQKPQSVLNKIYNLNVVGRRGNIVQTYPAIEYDFRPNVLTMKKGEWLHPQWTGSDNNANNQAGEGRDNTDRSNIVQIEDLRDDIPIAFNKQNMFDSHQAIRMAFGDVDGSLCKTRAQLYADNGEDDDDGVDEDANNCAKLNPDVIKYFDGDLQKMNQVGTFYYMSTRNNNFSNRGQKGVVIVEDCEPNCVFDQIDYIPGDKWVDYDPNTSSTMVASLLVMVLALF